MISLQISKFSKFYGLKVCFLSKFLSLHSIVNGSMENGQSVSSTTAMAFPQTLLPELRKPCGLLATEETDVMVEVTRQWLPRLSGPVLL